MRGNTDFTRAVTDSVTTRHDAYIQPFARAIGAGVPFVMVSLATYTRIDPSNLAVFSPMVMHTILRGDLAFHFHNATPFQLMSGRVRVFRRRRRSKGRAERTE